MELCSRGPVLSDIGDVVGDEEMEAVERGGHGFSKASSRRATWRRWASEVRSGGLVPVVVMSSGRRRRGQRVRRCGVWR